MGRGLRWASLSQLGAVLPSDLVVPKKKRQVTLGRGDAIGKVNKGEELFAFQCTACKLAVPKRNYLFHPTRKWEIDFAWPAHHIGIEIQGGIWGKSAEDKTGGAHGHPIGIMRDLEKHNALLDHGWRVWEFTPTQIKQGVAVKHMEAVLLSLSVTTCVTIPPEVIR